MNAKCDGKMHLGLGCVCMSVLTEECLPRKPCSQEETNYSTSKFCLLLAVLSVDLLWLNEEKRRGINFLTSGTWVPAGLCCAACGGCNISDVFCLPATAETLFWVLTTVVRVHFLSKQMVLQQYFQSPVQEKFVDVYSHFCLNCAKDKMAQIKLHSNFCSKKLLFGLGKGQEKTDEVKAVKLI